MPILSENLPVNINIDSVIRGQGADPGTIRSRKGKLLKTAKQALFESEQFIQNTVIYKELVVAAQAGETLHFNDGSYLQGQLIKDHLNHSEQVVVILCSVGEAIERHLSEVVTTNLLHGLAIHGVGSAAVESLANAACGHFSRLAKEKGMSTTIPISPGMEGWELHEGQRQIFSLLEQDGTLEIKLNHDGIMIPKKSLSMVIGIGKKVNCKGKPCDYCGMNEICQHKKSGKQLS
jgi:hypothetical protein